MGVHYLTAAQFSMELPHHVRRTLCLYHRVEQKMQLTVDPLVDHVVDRQRILVLWEALWKESHPDLGSPVRSRYPSGGSRHHSWKVVDLDRVVTGRGQICHCPGTAAHTYWLLLALQETCDCCMGTDWSRA
jgi:hypothetical protein